jgi:hypothetical protein
LAIIATAQLMVMLDATIVNVALPRIQRTLGYLGEWPGVGRHRLCALAATAEPALGQPVGAELALDQARS